MNSTPPQIPVLPVPLAHDMPHLAASLNSGGIIKIVALGSSSTAGEGGIVPYPHRLEMMLRDSYPDHTIDVLNCGIRGEEAPKEFDRIEKDVIAEKPNLVIWQIGTNSVWQSASEDPPSHDETIKAIRCGIDCLHKMARSISFLWICSICLPCSRQRPSKRLTKWWGQSTRLHWI